MSSCLYLVSTPIGNLKDITLRAIDTLKGANFIYCEDTRRTSKLCSTYGINTPLKSYHEHNAQSVRPLLIEQLQQGQSIALVSDAGTPLISDPGYKLVVECIAHKIKVVPIPGASALLSALVVSGLPPDHFYFGGFLPNKSSERQKIFLVNKTFSMTQVYYETANRLMACLRDVAEIYGDRSVCVARELTKAFEEIRSGTAEELIDYYTHEGTLRGEIVLLIEGLKEIRSDIDKTTEQVLALLLEQRTVKESVSLMTDLTHLPRNMIYQKALELKGQDDEP